MSSDKISNPSRHYASAQDVLDDGSLSDDDKKQSLHNWANELRQILAAEEESMMGDGDNAAKLSAIEQALLALGAEADPHDAKA